MSLFKPVLLVGVLFSVLSGPENAGADHVILTNHDRLSGSVVEQGETNLVLISDVLGPVRIPVPAVSSVEMEGEGKRVRGTMVWDNALRFGCSFFNGTSGVLNLAGSLKVNRNRLWVDEWTCLLDYRQVQEGSRVYARRIDASLRYAVSLSKPLYVFLRTAFFSSYKAGLNRQVTPSAGTGYWFSDDKGLKAMAEAGACYRCSVYAAGRTDREAALQFRTFLEWTFLPRTILGDDLYFYPSLEAGMPYSIRNSSFLKAGISGRFSLVFGLDADYDSYTGSSFRKPDLYYSLSLEYRF